jgi:hypothetical protein
MTIVVIAIATAILGFAVGFAIGWMLADPEL